MVDLKGLSFLMEHGDSLSEFKLGRRSTVEHSHSQSGGTWPFLNFWNMVISQFLEHSHSQTSQKKINLNLEEGQPKQFGTLFHKKLLSTEQNLNLKLEEGQLEFPIHEIQSIFKVKLEI